MTTWDTYPADYRAREVQAVLSAVRAGECVALVGLSGAGKSNLAGFLAHRAGGDAKDPHFVLVDGNRLAAATAAGFLHLARQALGDQSAAIDELAALETVIAGQLAQHPAGLCLVCDRFDALGEPLPGALAGNLRALRDAYKYQLTYVITTRRPPAPHSELAELFYAHTLWLGPLSPSDALWNVQRYAARLGQDWAAAAPQIINLSGGYPALLKAVCEAYAGGAALEPAALCTHPAVQRRVAEFWADQPDAEALRLSGLAGQALLGCPPVAAPVGPTVADDQLTAKEHLLLAYFRQHVGEVCAKDELVRAVWPEDKIYAQGIRDDSLAQLVRRLREKIEPEPSAPRYIQTVPGRGYQFNC
jgi:energy-coupling factor transporter ATP-binding protein EcfA2